MARNPANEDHPGVAEVRRWRAKAFKAAGGTLEALAARLSGPGSNGKVPAVKRPKTTTKRHAATPRVRKGKG